MKQLNLYNIFNDSSQNQFNPKFLKDWDNIHLYLTTQNGDLGITINIDENSIIELQSYMNLILGLRILYSKSTQRINLTINSNLSNYNMANLEILEMVWAFMVKKLIMNENEFQGFYSKEIEQIEMLINHLNQSNIML
jgi:hypothetical protein